MSAWKEPEPSREMLLEIGQAQIHVEACQEELARQEARPRLRKDLAAEEVLVRLGDWQCRREAARIRLLVAKDRLQEAINALPEPPTHASE